MAKKYMIIVTGPCGSGKTTIANSINKEYKFPLINKDAIKELLYDSVGYTDRKFSERLGRASYELLYFCVEKLLVAESTFIIESNFSGLSLKTKIKELKEKYDFEVIIIRCYAEKTVLFDRVIKRDESGERHPGHIYPTNYQEFKTMLLEQPVEFLDINVDIGELTIDVDTTVFNQELFEDIYNSLSDQMNSNLQK